MSTYRIEDSVVRSESATNTYDLGAEKSGYGYQTDRLHRTRRGRWWLEHTWDYVVDNQFT